MMYCASPNAAENCMRIFPVRATKTGDAYVIRYCSVTQHSEFEIEREHPKAQYFKLQNRLPVQNKFILLNKGHAIDFMQGRKSCKHFGNCRFAQRRQAFSAQIGRASCRE